MFNSSSCVACHINNGRGFQEKGQRVVGVSLLQEDVALSLPADHPYTLEAVAVTAGQRLAAVSWVQSLIRDPAEREILFDLDTVLQALFEQSGKTREFDLLSKTHANLLRKWSEC